MAALLTFASANLKGCTIRTDNGAEHSLRFGSDLWAASNASYHNATCADNLLPASVYFSELERSWSAERFNGSTSVDVAESYLGTSYSTVDDSVSYNDGDNRAALHTNLAEAEEMPIGHSILTHMFGTPGYHGPRFVYRNWSEIIPQNWPTHSRAIMKRM